MEAIYKRRSVRTYADLPVPEAVVESLLRAAMQAPSAGNQQPWEFLVVRDRTTLEEMAEASPYARMLKGAPVAIVLLMRSRGLQFSPWSVQDMSAATENLLLAAAAQDLGAVWLGIWPDAGRVEALRRILHVPEDLAPFSVVSLGWPQSPPEPVDRWVPERVWLDRYGQR